jgi:hypothetical protein
MNFKNIYLECLNCFVSREEEVEEEEEDVDEGKNRRRAANTTKRVPGKRSGSTDSGILDTSSRLVPTVSESLDFISYRLGLFQI